MNPAVRALHGSNKAAKKKAIYDFPTYFISGQVCRVVIEWKDRLARFGFTYIKKLFDAFNVELEIINHRDEQRYEEEITEDIIAIMTSYSARIYGKRGGRCKK